MNIKELKTALFPVKKIQSALLWSDGYCIYASPSGINGVKVRSELASVPKEDRGKPWSFTLLPSTLPTEKELGGGEITFSIKEEGSLIIATGDSFFIVTTQEEIPSWEDREGGEVNFFRAFSPEEWEYISALADMYPPKKGEDQFLRLLATAFNFEAMVASEKGCCLYAASNSHTPNTGLYGDGAKFLMPVRALEFLPKKEQVGISVRGGEVALLAGIVEIRFPYQPDLSDNWEKIPKSDFIEVVSSMKSLKKFLQEVGEKPSISLGIDPVKNMAFLLGGKDIKIPLKAPRGLGKLEALESRKFPLKELKSAIDKLGLVNGNVTFRVGILPTLVITSRSEDGWEMGAVLPVKVSSKRKPSAPPNAEVLPELPPEPRTVQEAKAQLQNVKADASTLINAPVPPGLEIKEELGELAEVLQKYNVGGGFDSAHYRMMAKAIKEKISQIREMRMDLQSWEIIVSFKE